MKHIIVIFGTRPEAIMMAPLIKELQKYPKEFDLTICSTGHQQELVDQVLRDFEITCDHSMKAFTGSKDMAEITSKVLIGISEVIKKTAPDYCFVVGDTNSSMGAALSAYYQKIPVIHLQAGLRTNDIYSPFPNELNRQIIGRIAWWNFSPTSQGKSNLVKENVSSDRILVSGDTVIDALHWMLKKISLNRVFEDDIRSQICSAGYNLQRIDSSEDDDIFMESHRRMVLVTGYRHESLDGFAEVMLSLEKLAEQFPDVDFVYPQRSKEKTCQEIKDSIVDNTCRNLFFIQQIGYGAFVYLMKRCHLVLSDSGLIQEEAPALGKPVLIMREHTERPEAIFAGTVITVGTSFEKIVCEVSRLLTDKNQYEEMSRAINPYGDGLASMRIVKKLIDVTKN